VLACYLAALVGKFRLHTTLVGKCRLQMALAGTFHPETAVKHLTPQLVTVFRSTGPAAVVLSQSISRKHNRAGR
jgi:hypothetical protein